MATNERARKAAKKLWNEGCLFNGGRPQVEAQVIAIISAAYPDYDALRECLTWAYTRLRQEWERPTVVDANDMQMIDRTEKLLVPKPASVTKDGGRNGR
jgi:hypothetical protein